MANLFCLTDYDGAIWRSGIFAPIPTCMYITERSICLDSNEMLVYPFKDITSISKDSTVPFISNAILKFQTRQGTNFFFVLYKGASKAHETLESVWSANLSHWQNELALASESSNSFNKKGAEASSSAAPSPARNVLASKNTALLKRANAIQQFSQKFLVPEEPLVDYAVSLVGIKDHSPMLVGTLTLTTSFACWTNNVQGPQRMQVVIAAASMLSIKAEALGLGIGVTSFVVIETDEGNRLKFASLHPNQLKADLDKMKERHVAYVTRQNEKHLPAASTYALLRNGYQMDISRESNPDHQDIQARLQGHWTIYFGKYGRGASMILYNQDLDNLLKLGIPDIYRHEVWPLLCGATQKLNANAGQYAEYLTSDPKLLTSQAAQDIDKDLHRSMPSHPYYASQPKNLEPLRNVLLAYAARNPAIGYCQGMNIVAAMLLLYLPEEVAFWVLTSIVEEIAPDYYNKQLFGSQVDQKVFNRLVKTKYPDLYAHLKKVGMPLHLLTLPWFMTFLIECVPWESSLMVLDNLLRNGTCVLFQTSLAILTLTYEEIMAEKSENEQIPLLIRAHPFDPYELMKIAFNKFSYINPESIRRMRTEGKAARLNDMQESAHKQLLMKVKRKFKESTTWKPEQIDELDGYYRNHGRGNLLGFDGFKQVLLKYAPFIEKNIIKPDQAPLSPTPMHSSAHHSASETSSADPTPDPDADLIIFSSSELQISTESSEKTDSELIITPPATPNSDASGALSRPSWEFASPMSPAFADGIFEAIWRAHQSAPGGTSGMDLLGLITVLDMILHHTPAQLFTWLRHILYPESTHAYLDREQFERLLLGLYLLNYMGEAPFSSNAARIKQFIPLIYEQMGGNALTLDATQIQELVVDCELLDGFWSRLYYIDLGSSSAGIPNDLPESDVAPSGPPNEGNEADLMSFGP